MSPGTRGVSSRRLRRRRPCLAVTGVVSREGRGGEGMEAKRDGRLMYLGGSVFPLARL